MAKNKSMIILILIVTLTTGFFVSSKKHFQPIPKLMQCVEQDKYSDLYDELSKNRSQYQSESLLLYDIIMKSVLNKPEESNQYIKKFRTEFSGMDDTTSYYITQTEYNNYLKLCDYKKLKEIGNVLILKYERFIDSSDYVELKDDYVRYTYLEHEKAIVVDKQSDTNLKIHKDLAGYTLLSVKGSNDSTVDFIFDTGANVNVMTESSAKKMNLRIIPDSKIYVLGSTDVRNEAYLGMADTMTIGNIKIYNAEFVVFADSLLTFAGGRYMINGAVGFPVFSRFEEISFDDSTLSIPRLPGLPAVEPNMFIKSDDYILAVEYNKKKYPFLFDTGNENTYFKKNFYDIDSASFKRFADTMFTYGGVGGIKSVKAKRPDSITLRYSGKSFTMARPFIELEYGQSDKNLYGNIGKDFVHCHKKRIMSFKEARLQFE